MKSDVTARAAAMGYCSHQLNRVQEARRVKDKALTHRGVTLVSTTDGIDSSTPTSRMTIGVLSSLAEYERELVKERTALKRQASRAKRHQVRAAQQGERQGQHRHSEPNEAGWSHRVGHRQVLQGQPGDAVSVPSRRACLGNNHGRRAGGCSCSGGCRVVKATAAISRELEGAA